MIEPEDLLAASMVVVIRGADYAQAVRDVPRKRKHRRAEPRDLHTENDPTAIAEISRPLTDVVPGADGMDWMEWPQASFVFLSGGRVLRELGLLSSATYVRDPEFRDLPLQDPAGIDRWLRRRGVELLSPPGQDL